MKILTLLFTFALAGCGSMEGAELARCTLQSGAPSTVVCSCASSCTIRPDLLVDATELEGCGPTSCWQDSRATLDAGTLDAGGVRGDHRATLTAVPGQPVARGGCLTLKLSHCVTAIYPPGELAAIVELEGHGFVALGKSKEHAAAEVLKLLADHLAKISGVPDEASDPGCPGPDCKCCNGERSTTRSRRRSFVRILITYFRGPTRSAITSAQRVSGSAGMTAGRASSARASSTRRSSLSRPRHLAGSRV